jgi:DNA-binding transcriptional MerR regulator
MLKEQCTYSISEVAKTLGVSANWLRFEERLGALPRARRTPGGHRYYTPEDIARLRRLGVGQRKQALQQGGRDE